MIHDILYILHTWNPNKISIFWRDLNPNPLKTRPCKFQSKQGAPFGEPRYLLYKLPHPPWPWGVEIRLQEPQDAPEGLPRNQGAAPNRLMHEYGRDFWLPEKRGGGIEDLPGVWRCQKIFRWLFCFWQFFYFFLFFWSFSRFLNLVTGRSVTKILKDVLFMGLLLFGVHFWVRFWENLPKTRFGKFTGSGVFFCIFVIFLFHAEQKETPAKIHMSSEKEPFFKRKIHLPTSNHRFLRDIWGYSKIVAFLAVSVERSSTIPS